MSPRERPLIDADVMPTSGVLGEPLDEFTHDQTSLIMNTPIVVKVSGESCLFLGVSVEGGD